MEYSIGSFTTLLRQLMYDRFPRENQIINLLKHKKRPLHIRDVAFNDNPTIYSDNEAIFDIGNERAEREYPYYHILEDAPIIRKRGKSTAKTRGSQATIEDLGKRDYGRVKWNGKTFSKEYARNVRGSRNRRASVSHWATDYMGNDIFINREANAYENVHYKYIEKMLNGGILDELATTFGLTRKRTVDTGLGEEYAMQVDEGESIIAAITSHND